MTQWRILARFYDALDISTRQNLDNGGPFLHLSEDEALQRLDVLAKYSHQYHEGKTKKDVGSISNDDKDGEIRALKAKLVDIKNFKFMKDYEHHSYVHGERIYLSFFFSL